MRRVFLAVVVVLGAICIVIAASHIAIGQRVIPGGLFVNPTMDSEDRFYATLFLGWGAAMIYCARDLAARKGLFHALLAIFFLGGVARIVSALAVGLPSPLFVFLGALELILPPLLWGWRRAAMPDEGP